MVRNKLKHLFQFFDSLSGLLKSGEHVIGGAVLLGCVDNHCHRFVGQVSVDGPQAVAQRLLETPLHRIDASLASHVHFEAEGLCLV